jgi:hypothetical protein
LATCPLQAKLPGEKPSETYFGIPRKMENTPFRRPFGSHIFAIVCGTAFFTIVPSALYGGLIVWSGDLGGPLNLFLIPVMSAAAGFALSLVIFMPVSLLAEETSLKTWLRIVGVSLVALTVPVALAWASAGAIKPQHRVYLVVGSVSVYVVAGFFVYLCSLALSPRILRRSQ